MGKTLRWLAMFALVLSLSCVLLPVYGQDPDAVDEGTTGPGLEEEGLGAGGDELTEDDGLSADAVAGDYETDKALEAQMKAEEAKRDAKAAFEAGDYGMAVAKLQEAVGYVPDDTETLSRLKEVQKAYIYDLLKSDNYDAVIKQADDFLARFTDPEDAAVMQVTSFRSSAVELAAAAATAVTPAEGEEAGAAPRTDSGLLIQARQAYRKKDYNLARDLLLEAREINPYNVEVMRLLERTTDQIMLYSRSEREYIRASMILDIEDTWRERPRRAEATAGPLDIPKEEPIPKPRQEILAKLDTIIEVVDFKDAQLEEVINYLAREANVNIVIDPVVFWTPGGTAAPETGTGGFTPGGETLPGEGPLEIPGGEGPAPGEFGDLAPQGMPGGSMPGGGRPGGGFGTEPGFGTGTGGFGGGTGGFGGGTGGFGGGTGMGGYAAPASSTITIHLVGAPLREVLKYVLRYKNLKYVVEDYAILIIPIDYVLPEEMITEIFRLSTSGIGISQMQPASEWGGGESTFGGGGFGGNTGGGGFGGTTGGFGGGGGGGGFGGGGGTTGGFGMGQETSVGQPETIEEWLRRAGGVTWPPGSNLVYHQSTAVLVVTNTPSNMVLIRELVKIWDKPPMQVEVEARFADVIMSRDFENSFEANMLDALRWTRNSGSGWGTRPLGARERVELLAVPGETLRTVTDPYGGWLSIKGILTRPEFELVWHSLEQTDYTEILNAPRVTTISGQQALIQVVERIRYPTEYETESLQDVYLAGVSAEDLQAFMLTPSSFEEADIGIRLTVTPTVSSDGQVITLVLLPEVSELVDWDDYGTPLNPARQPRFKMRNITTTVYINDGETLVLGGIIESNNNLVQDRVPVLGSIPILGRLFRSTYESEEKTNLMVFVTADLITSRGTRVRQENQIRERRAKLVEELARRREAAEAMQ